MERSRVPGTSAKIDLANEKPGIFASITSPVWPELKLGGHHGAVQSPWNISED